MLCDGDDGEDKEEEGCFRTNENIANFCVHNLTYVEHFARVWQLKMAQNRIIIGMGKGLQ